LLRPGRSREGKKMKSRRVAGDHSSKLAKLPGVTLEIKLEFIRNERLTGERIRRYHHHLVHRGGKGRKTCGFMHYFYV